MVPLVLIVFVIALQAFLSFSFNSIKDDVESLILWRKLDSVFQTS
jgi:hypothetical protein